MMSTEPVMGRSGRWNPILFPSMLTKEEKSAFSFGLPHSRGCWAVG